MKKEELKEGVIDYPEKDWITKQSALDLIDQLDEPSLAETSVLLENVLKENKRLGKLCQEKQEEIYKLLDSQSSKPEKVVIPQWFADWYESRGYDKSLYGAFYELYSKHQQKMDEWAEQHEMKHAELQRDIASIFKIGRNGYTVEEPLYRARLKVITDEFIASYLRTQSSDVEDRLKALEIGSKYIHEDYRHLSEFTEDELKRINIWDSEQWEVEELEE